VRGGAEEGRLDPEAVDAVLAAAGHLQISGLRLFSMPASFPL
jgi:hypothetical protein